MCYRSGQGLWNYPWFVSTQRVRYLSRDRQFRYRLGELREVQMDQGCEQGRRERKAQDLTGNALVWDLLFRNKQTFRYL